MNLSDRNKRVNNVLNLIREDGSVLATSNQLLEKYTKWINFDYEDWIVILNTIRNEPLKLYAFITFAYRVLGINLVHEFLKIEEIKQEVAEYVNKGQNLPIQSISDRDIIYFQENRKVIEEINKNIIRYKKQGAKVIKEYKVLSRKVDKNIIFRYVRIINREELTEIKLEELVENKYKISERLIKNRKST